MAHSISINPVWLTISPPRLEDEFWQQQHVVGQLINIDRFAFLMSTINIYSGWKAAGAAQSSPVTSRTMQVLCVVFFVLSVWQQLLIRQRPAWYLHHRELLVLLTRFARGGWMVVMFLNTSERDIQSYFIARKLENNTSPELVVVQLLMMLSLIFLGQCLYWPVRFCYALPVQLLYIFTALAAMNNVKCTVNLPAVAAGTRSLCYRIQFGLDVMGSVLAGSQMAKGRAPADAQGLISRNGSDSASYGGSALPDAMCSIRGHEEVVYWVLTVFGLALPLYVMYVRELAQKKQYLRHKHVQLQHQVQGTRLQHRQRPQLGQQLNMAPVLHAAALAVLLVIAAIFCDFLLVVLPPPACTQV